VRISDISDRLQLREDGVWHAENTARVSYPSGGNADCFQLEDHSFWFQHRNRCIVAAVKAHPPQSGGAILDIGGGNGFVSKGLMESGFNVALLEPGYEGVNNAKRRGVDPVVCASVHSAGIKMNSLAAVGLFDVIEHIEDDGAFMTAIVRLLVTGGKVYATVPSHKWLWSAEDADAGHFRRYSLGRISRLFSDSGLRILYSTYIFRFLPLPIYVLRSLPYRLGLKRLSPERSRHYLAPPIATPLIKLLLAGEVSNIDKSAPMAFGATCLVVAEAV
jgi:2-polyprenyl-3-methyl-5-hydroxy-6-metoxy-1,4-benzoquinol methylase